MGGSFGSTFFGGGTSTLLSGAGFGPSESSTVPNVAYSRAGEPVQIRVDWPENFNTDVVGLFSLATPVYDPYELGEVPYEFAGSGMGYFSMNQAAWDRLSEEERAQMIADAQAANQQDAISRMYALQAASTVAPNIITQMLQLGGGN
jgi:hypothetical protein